MESAARNDFKTHPPARFDTLEDSSVRFSIGDLIVEKRMNHWFYAGDTYGFGYTMSPYYSPSYWEDYYEVAKTKKPPVGIVIDVKENEPTGYYQADVFMSYRVMWLNLDEESDAFLMERWFYGDELRLLSKINRSRTSEGETEDE